MYDPLLDALEALCFECLETADKQKILCEGFSAFVGFIQEIYPEAIHDVVEVGLENAMLHDPLLSVLPDYLKGMKEKSRGNGFPVLIETMLQTETEDMIALAKSHFSEALEYALSYPDMRASMALLQGWLKIGESTDDLYVPLKTIFQAIEKEEESPAMSCTEKLAQGLCRSEFVDLLMHERFQNDQKLNEICKKFVGVSLRESSQTYDGTTGLGSKRKRTLLLTLGERKSQPCFLLGYQDSQRRTTILYLSPDRGTTWSLSAVEAHTDKISALLDQYQKHNPETPEIVSLVHATKVALELCEQDNIVRTSALVEEGMSLAFLETEEGQAFLQQTLADKARAEERLQQIAQEHVAIEPRKYIPH